MKLVERICFPTDFGKSSEVALESVISTAKKFGSEVDIVHVLPESMNLDKVQNFVDEKLNGYKALLEAQNVKCSSHLLHGNHIDVLVSFAERKKANLIVLGAGHIGKEKFKLGTSSEKIIRNSSIPVWVVEKDNTVIPERVLCSLDFSEESLVALDNAVHLCRRFNASLNILHVVQKIDREYSEWGFDVAEEQAQLVKNIGLDLDDAIQDIDLSGITWTKEVKVGSPTDVILTYIKEHNIDLLMMGSTGKGTLQRLFIGSIAERVTRQVPCSFIINKTEGMIRLKLDKGISDIESIYNEGVELAKQGFVQEAIIEWKRCIYKNELYFKAWSAIVKAYESLGDVENATKHNESRERIQKVLWDKQIEADLRGKHYLFQ